MNIISLPGKFTKIVNGDRIIARVHKMADGRWVGGSKAPYTMEFGSETAAVSWVLVTGIATELGEAK